MKRFAKVFDTDATQVLVYVEYDSVKEEHKLHRILDIYDIRVDACPCWPDDGNGDGESLAYAEFDSFDQSAAESLVVQLKNELRHFDTSSEEKVR